MKPEYECRAALLQMPLDFYPHVVDNDVNVHLGVKEKETVDRNLCTFYYNYNGKQTSSGHKQPVWEEL